MREINFMVQRLRFEILFWSTPEKEKGVIRAKQCSNSVIKHPDPPGKGLGQREIKISEIAAR